MKNRKAHFWKIAYRFGLIVMGVQVLMGVCWMAYNIGAVPNFGETQELLELSQTWALDEYVRVGYVALIALAKGLQGLCGVPFQIPLYLMQLGLGMLSVYALLKAFFEGKAWLRWLISGYVNTMPFLLQAHFSVLPYSLAGAVYLLLAAVLVGCIRKADSLKPFQANRRGLIKRTALVVALWTMGVLMLPEFCVLAGCLIAFFAIYVSVRHPHLRGWLVVLVVAAVLCSIVPGLTTEAGSRGKMQNTIQAQAVRRLAWPDIFRMNAFWDTEVKECFTVDELLEISMAAERMTDTFGPRIEGSYGRDKANELYANMAITALGTNTKAVVKQLASDMAVYLCPPIAIALETRGFGSSYTGWNYEKLQAQNVPLTKRYVEWSVLSFVALMVLAMLQIPGYFKKYGMFFACAALCVISQAAYYTWTTGGMVSYLKSPVNFVMWGLLASGWLSAAKEEE